jgi:TonB family protein
MPLKASVACCIAILLLFLVSRTRAQTQPSVSSDVGKTRPDVPLKVGNGVTAPRPKYSPDPQYTEDARVAGREGTCVLWLIVDADGKTRDIKVARRLGMGLDENAIEAVRTWRFKPARKDGKPVAVQINVEVDFRLYTDKKIPKLLQKAEAGDAKAALELSEAYFEGRGVAKDEARGLALLDRAAKKGLPRAQFLMGEYERAHGTSSADYVTAYMWYALARRGGYKPSDRMLEELASKMSPEQLSDAKTRVENWPNTSAK